MAPRNPADAASPKVDAVDIRSLVADNLGEEELFDVKQHDAPDDDDEGEGGPTLTDPDDDEDEEAIQELLGDKTKERTEERQDRKPAPREQPAQRSAAPQDFNKAPPRYAMDKQGNIINPSTGTILARNGAEARLFQGKTKAELVAFQRGRDLASFQSSLDKAVGYAQRYLTENKNLTKDRDEYAKKGLSAADQRDALDLAVELSNPSTAIAGMKKVLTRLAMRGINVTELGLPAAAPGGKEIAEVFRTEIEKLTKPIAEQNRQTAEQKQAQERQSEAAQQLERETVNFFAQNTDAVPYATVIAAALRNPQYRDYTIREVWQEIQIHLLKKQRGEGSGNGRKPPNSIPSGRRRPATERYEPGSAPVGTEYNTIIDGILEAAGWPK